MELIKGALVLLLVFGVLLCLVWLLWKLLDAALFSSSWLAERLSPLLRAALPRTSLAPAELAARIDALLPQTQCGQCAYPGCKPYAEAVAAGDAINKCIPGGEAGVAQLARLTGRPPLPLALPEKPKRLALIREAECIGCTKCIQACPVDAIVGAAKLMHTVIAAECTGCELCLPPCPVDCISLVAPAGEPIALRVLS